MLQNIAHSLDSKIRTRDVISDKNINFESLLLPQNILKGLHDSGFKKPSPIQVKALPVGRCGFDLIVKSKSGTGKTLVFAIIALQTVDVSKGQLEVLILAPTREIAVQIRDVIQGIGCHVEGLRVESFIGGLSLEADKAKCKLCHIAVGAPGRIKHLINQGILQTNGIRLLVLDEADKLMDPSFENDINEIYNSLSQRKQIITTSATYPNKLETFLSEYMLSPTCITSEVDTPLLLGLKQFVKIVKAPPNVVQGMKAKNEEMLNVLSNISFTQCLVFSNYQTRTESVSNFLNQKGWNSEFISAAQSQPERLTALSNLKNFKCRILLSTDLTARGIDAANVDLVINYDIPVDAMTYLHRMGRAGRYGSTGICLNLAFDGKELQLLEKILGTIGGSSLCVPKLPEIKGTMDELLNLEISQENSICGVVVPDEEQNIKKEVLEIKERRYTSKTLKKESTANKITKTSGSIKATAKENNSGLTSLPSELNIDPNCNRNDCLQNSKSPVNKPVNKSTNKTNKKNAKCAIEKTTNTYDLSENIVELLHDSKTDRNDLGEQYLSLDTKSILDLMASGNLNMQPNTTVGISLPDINTSKHSSNIEDTKRRCLDGQETINETNKDVLEIQKNEILNILEPCKKEDKNNTEKFSGADTKSLLSLLASGELKMATNVLSVQCAQSNLNIDDYKRRKRSCENVAGSSLCNNTNLNIKTPEKLMLLDKNKALLSVSKLLVNEKTDPEKSDIDSIRSYLDHLKQQDREVSEFLNKTDTTDVIEILKDVENLHKNNASDNEWDLENIFRLGFESIVKSDNCWRSCVSDSEVKKFEKLCLNEKEESDDEIDYSEYSDYNMEEGNCYDEDEINIVTETKTKNQEPNISDESTDFMKWIPVEKSQESGLVPTCALNPENSSYEHYNKYFDQCDHSLWQNGLTFENVDNFDDWFHYEWQAQVFAIRNYVQQKIYLEEMNRYQSQKGCNRES